MAQKALRALGPTWLVDRGSARDPIRLPQQACRQSQRVDRYNACWSRQRLHSSALLMVWGREARL